MEVDPRISIDSASSCLEHALQPSTSAQSNVLELGAIGAPLSRWYVAQVLSQKEGYAAEHLARQGFQTFFPRFYKLRSHARKKETMLAPLFPGYIFVKFDIKMDRWLAVNSTRGVLRLVGPRISEPHPIPSRVIELLKARCRAGVLTKLPDDMNIGDRIQINAGPLAGQVATIESLNDQSRISVLLSLLGTEHSLSVNADQLAPLAVAGI